MGGQPESEVEDIAELRRRKEEAWRVADEALQKAEAAELSTPPEITNAMDEGNEGRSHKSWAEKVIYIHNMHS